MIKDCRPWRLISTSLRAPLVLLARDAFVRTNRRAIAMMSFCLCVWDSRALRSHGALWRGFKFTVG